MPRVSGQTAHSAAPGKLKEFTKQSEHAVAPFADANVPSTQGVHADELERSAYVPAPHGSHTDDAFDSNCPGWQSAHFSCVGSATAPGPHFVHSCDRCRETKSSGHAAHRAASVSYRPVWQATHSCCAEGTSPGPHCAHASDSRPAT